MKEFLADSDELGRMVLTEEEVRQVHGDARAEKLAEFSNPGAKNQGQYWRGSPDPKPAR